MNDYSALEQFLYDTGIAMPGDVRRRASQIKNSDWLKEHDREVIADFVNSLEYEYAQGFETDYYDTWYVGKSFGHEKDRPIDEGYTLIKRGLLPWEKAEEEN